MRGFWHIICLYSIPAIEPWTLYPNPVPEPCIRTLHSNPGPWTLTLYSNPGPWTRILDPNPRPEPWTLGPNPTTLNRTYNYIINYSIQVYIVYIVTDPTLISLFVSIHPLELSRDNSRFRIRLWTLVVNEYFPYYDKTKYYNNIRIVFHKQKRKFYLRNKLRMYCTIPTRNSDIFWLKSPPRPIAPRCAKATVVISGTLLARNPASRSPSSSAFPHPHPASGTIWR